jgi:hypothetical protein
MHASTFGHVAPTEEQKEQMTIVRTAAADYADVLIAQLPDGPDKTYVLRALRTVAMWANVSLTRNADGSPRGETQVSPKDYPADHPVPGDLGSVPL